MQERRLLRSLSSLRSSLPLSTVRTSQNGSHEGHEGDEGDEGNEGDEVIRSLRWQSLSGLWCSSDVAGRRLCRSIGSGQVV